MTRAECAPPDLVRSKLFDPAVSIIKRYCVPGSGPLRRRTPNRCLKSQTSMRA